MIEKIWMIAQKNTYMEGASNPPYTFWDYTNGFSDEAIGTIFPLLEKARETLGEVQRANPDREVCLLSASVYPVPEESLPTAPITE